MQDKAETEKPKKSEQAQTEEKILEFWEKNEIFNKTLEKEAPKGEFIFYDGPPFATGEPHYGHVVPGTIKDIIPRYKTMKGYRVRRRWGWDCHGLPVENLIEKELGLQSKKDINDYGVGNFNQKAKDSVMRYANDWRKIIPRLGRWVDMDDDYKTMDTGYTESVWWAFSELHKKGLIYEGFKSMHLCPRCETTLSNFEVSQGYKDITDISVYVKFELTNEPGAFLLAWTTTPWTLPGNSALAVGKNVKYVKVLIGNEKYILAESRLSVLKQEYKVLEEVKVENLIGKPYKPLFDYYSKDQSLKNKENGWKIYEAGFVTTEDGTGIVHIAPAFGADDYELSLKYSLPFIQHVASNGIFKPEVSDFAGLHVKPKDTQDDKDAHQRADIEIIKYLAGKNLLFAKEKLIHSYPHCWRCDTPLLNYATSSWFVKVTDIKDKLVKENKKIKWIPEEIGEGRFGNWLSGARDWAISRSRFWGAPLPVWKDEKTEKITVIGSIAELKSHSKPKNTYYVMRHGEADNNVKAILSSLPNHPHHLTKLGKEQVLETAKVAKGFGIDLIVSSPFIRTRETAEIVASEIGLDKSKIEIENRFHELNAGIWNGKPLADFLSFFEKIDRFEKKAEGGESYVDIKKRMGDALYDLEKKYKGKTILIVTHSTPAFLLFAAAKGLDRQESIVERGMDDHYLQNAEIRPLNFIPIPHNREYEFDLHRPFIDEAELFSKDGNKLIRIPEVFDCWFESGSMPFGEAHYPFVKDNFDPNPGFFRKKFGKKKGYPADFIAEGLDQTRGWFYSMLVLGVALFGRSPYEKVIVNGLVLAPDGQKMSKSKKNYPDIMYVIDKYGADAMRYFLMSSPVVRAQDVCFIEKSVDEVAKKHIGRLNNVVSFFEMYSKGKIYSCPESLHPLDKWITNRLKELGNEVSKFLELSEIDRAIRPFADFIDDLSTWYIRRSRDRFKSEKCEERDEALSTARNILKDLAKLVAPFMPFLAEDVYKRVGGERESVHLEDWPAFTLPEKKIIDDMKIVRNISSLGLEARSKAKVNVRQPLLQMKVKQALPKDESLISLIKEEVNVKSISSENNLKEEVWLDTSLTPELKEEGIIREMIRAIQDLRKEKGLTIEDKALLYVDADEYTKGLISKNKTLLSGTTLLQDIEFKDVQGEIKDVGGISLKLDIRKQ